MLRCLMKVYFPLLPIHIFLSALWSFLLHPTILIIFCHQASSSSSPILQSSMYIHNHFLLSPYTTTHNSHPSSSSSSVSPPRRPSRLFLFPPSMFVSSTPLLLRLSSSGREIHHASVARVAHINNQYKPSFSSKSKLIEESTISDFPSSSVSHLHRACSGNSVRACTRSLSSSSSSSSSLSSSSIRMKTSSVYSSFPSPRRRNSCGGFSDDSSKNNNNDESNDFEKKWKNRMMMLDENCWQTNFVIHNLQSNTKMSSSSITEKGGIRRNMKISMNCEKRVVGRSRSSTDFNNRNHISSFCATPASASSSSPSSSVITTFRGAAARNRWFVDSSKFRPFELRSSRDLVLDEKVEIQKEEMMEKEIGEEEEEENGENEEEENERKKMLSILSRYINTDEEIENLSLDSISSDDTSSSSSSSEEEYEKKKLLSILSKFTNTDGEKERSSSNSINSGNISSSSSSEEEEYSLKKLVSFLSTYTNTDEEKQRLFSDSINSGNTSSSSSSSKEENERKKLLSFLSTYTNTDEEKQRLFLDSISSGNTSSSSSSSSVYSPTTYAMGNSGGSSVVASVPLSSPISSSSSSSSSFLLSSSSSSSSSHHRRGSSSPSFVAATKTISLIVLWYAANCHFNIQNKKALLLLPLPFTVSALQSLVGVPLAVFPWLLRLRRFPVIYDAEKGGRLRGWKVLILQGFWHTVLHLSAMCALASGAVSFVSIVKAGEPVLTAGLGGLLLGKWLNFSTYITLFPIILGVGLASVKELSFTWKSFLFSMLSNFGSSMRGITAKQTLSNKKRVGSYLFPSNLFAITALISTIMEVPMVLVEKNMWKPTFSNYLNRIQACGISKFTVFRHIFFSGFFYYLYNILAMSVLNGLHPVTHAVANALKRVTVIIVSMIIFRTRFTPLGVVGSGMAVLGTFLYSMSKRKTTKENEENNEEKNQTLLQGLDSKIEC